MSNKAYKNEVESIIYDGLNNFITTGNPDELDFRLWLGERKNYYKFKIANIVLARNPTNKIEVYTYLQEEVDKIKKEWALDPMEKEEKIGGRHN